jgi:hypothetical protein
MLLHALNKKGSRCFIAQNILPGSSKLFSFVSVSIATISLATEHFRSACACFLEAGGCAAF